MAMIGSEGIYGEILESCSKGETVALATIVKTTGSTPGKVGFKMLIYSDGRISGTVGGGCNEAKVIYEALEAINTGQPKLITLTYTGVNSGSPICGGTSEVFIEPILTQPTLYIFGAGHIAQALTKIAKTIGFRTAVFDDREEFANRERFPEADEVHVIDFNRVQDVVKLKSNSYVVIVTRGHKHDQDVLKSVLKDDKVAYVGMIGSSKKVKEVFSSLIQEGVNEALLKKVCAPIGLDIGAKTPAEIAVSITAEIIAKRHGKIVQGSSHK